MDVGVLHTPPVAGDRHVVVSPKKVIDLSYALTIGLRLVWHQ